jgi:transcription elongation factor Elf1
MFISNYNDMGHEKSYHLMSESPMSSKRARKLFKCPHCEAIYEVTYARVHVRDKDNAICEVCKKEMDRWQSTTYPKYVLLTKSTLKA